MMSEPVLMTCYYLPIIRERGESGSGSGVRMVHASSELRGLPTIMLRHNGTITEKPTTGKGSQLTFLVIPESESIGAAS